MNSKIKGETDNYFIFYIVIALVLLSKVTVVSKYCRANIIEWPLNFSII